MALSYKATKLTKLLIVYKLTVIRDKSDNIVQQITCWIEITLLLEEVYITSCACATKSELQRGHRLR